MGGMTMWIILGSLVGVVVIFLIFTATMERKKVRKNFKVRKNKEIKTYNYIKNISKKLKRIIDKNNHNLKNFIPSIGKMKMSDINNEAKKKLLEIKNSHNFHLIKEYDEEMYQDFSKHLNNLITIKSNNWFKKAKDDILFFKKFEFQPQKIENTKKGKKKRKKRNESSK